MNDQIEKSKPDVIVTFDYAVFIKAHTQLSAVPLRPDIKLYLADDATQLWQKTQDALHTNTPLPFWASAWAGGQALARYLLEHPDVTAGQRVLDFASGSGLVAIAAAKAGATYVEANDVDPFAIAAITLNRAANHAELITVPDNIIGAPSRWDVLLAGDIVYEREMAERVVPWLAHLANNGTCVLIGDPGRTYLPRESLHSLARYDVSVSLNLEDSEVKATDVWAFKSEV